MKGDGFMESLKHVNNFTKSGVTHAVVKCKNGILRTACRHGYNVGDLDEVLPIPDARQVTCMDCVHELAYSREERIRDKLRHVGNYTYYTRKTHSTTHAVMEDSDGNLKTPCGALLDVYIVEKGILPEKPDKAVITCKRCRKSLMSLFKRGLLEPNIPVSNEVKTSDSKIPKGKKIFVLYRDMINLVDDLSELTEGDMVKIKSIVVVDSYREYEVVEKTSYEFEEIETE